MQRNLKTSKWSPWRLKPPDSRLFTQASIQAQIKEKNQSSASLAFLRGIYRWPVNSPQKRSLTRKTFPFDDIIMGKRKRGSGESSSHVLFCRWKQTPSLEAFHNIWWATYMRFRVNVFAKLKSIICPISYFVWKLVWMIRISDAKPSYSF